MSEELPSAIPIADYVVLSVSDDGSGMDEETQERIFEPFFTTKESGDGTGLGLAMVYGIVAQSGGYIDLQSRVGEGTTFRIYLPELPAETTEELAEPVTEASEEDGTILLVEDEGLVRTLAREILESDGHEVLVAGDSQEAFDVSDLHEGSIDVLLTDLVLPGMSGIDLSRAIRKRRPNIRTLLVSGYDYGLLGPEERKLPFLQKPFDRSALLSAVREVLRAEA
jgi:CheY-like chemotaxis protein